MSRQIGWHSQKYHDFPKLRELHRARLASQMGNSTSSPMIYSLNTSAADASTWPSLRTPLTQQSRPFMSAMLRDLNLKRLEVQANADPTDVHLQQQFFSELLQHHPDAAAARLTHPEFQQFAISRDMVVQFLQQHPTGVSGNTIESLVQRLAVHNPADAALPAHWKELVHTHKWNGSDQIANLLQLLRTGSVAGASVAGATAPALLRGLDSKSPLYVSLASPVSGTSSARAAVVSFVSRAALLLLAVSAVGALLDDRGLGGARGIGGMNANSKHVQEATASNVKFSQVKGVAEAKQELEEIVLYLKDPTKFTRLGGKLPRGLLLTGPPGTGKTLLAKAIAGEAGVPFFFSSGSQFEEVYVGLGAKRIRELFEAAKKKSPAIIFIDEIDAVGGTRKLKDQSALKMTLNELLVQLDGFEENNGIIVIGATNFMESLDPALLRPGRFDKHVTVPLPDVGGRKEILELYAKKTKLAPEVDLSVLARGTTGMSGADLFNLMNQAALKASVDGLPHITQAVLEFAKDKILMGAERKTAVISKETAKCTAYHEAGHALVAVLTTGAMPIHKATIMPRGNALGMVTMLPEGDQTSQSYKEMLAYMDVAMGGRVAEELIFGRENVTSGASSDIQHATRIARNMVTKYGFSDQVGIVFHGGSTGEESASAETRARIDAEVQRLTQEAYQRAKDLLQRYRTEHKLLAETLLEYETLTGDEVRELIQRRRKPQRQPMVRPPRSDDSSSSSKSNSSSSSRGGGIRGRLFGKDQQQQQ